MNRPRDLVKSAPRAAKPRASSVARQAAVSLGNETQAVERERQINFVYELGGGRNQRRESAGRDDARAASEFLDHSAEYAIRESSLAVVSPRLYRRDGRSADDRMRALDAYARQACGARKQ